LWGNYTLEIFEKRCHLASLHMQSCLRVQLGQAMNTTREVAMHVATFEHSVAVT